MNRGRRAATLQLLAGGLSGCSLYAAPGPRGVDLQYDNHPCPVQAPVLLVLLPGAQMTPAEMRAQGMVQAVRERGLAVDMVLAALTLDHLRDGSAFERLHDAVMQPYRARGYRRIWLVGISLGAYVAMGYAARHPGGVEGIVAIAPYLGRAGLLQQVAAAGGAAAWQAQAAAQSVGQEHDAADADAQLWRWIARRDPDAPALFLSHGQDDRFAQAQRLLAQTIAPARVRSAAGGHDWAPWRRLWSDWLDLGLLPRVCAA